MQEEQINIREYIQMLLRRKYLIILVFVLSMPFIVIHALSSKPQPLYSAVSKLMIEKGSSPGLITSEGFRYDPGFLDTQTQIIKSSRVAEEVVHTLNLVETYDQYFSGIKHTPSMIQNAMARLREIPEKLLQLAGLISVPEPDEPTDFLALSQEQIREMRIKSLAAMISSGISVQPAAEGGSIVWVSYTSPSPVFAERVVNSVAAAYQRILMQMRMESTLESLEWMKSQAEAQRAHLEASETVLQHYKREHNLYTVGDREALLPERISRLSQRLTEAQTEVIELESQYRELSRINPQQALNLPLISNNPIIRDLRQKILNQEHEIESLSKQIGERHPRMIQARKDLETLQTTLDNEIGVVIQSFKNSYELAREKRNNIQGLLNEARQEASDTSDRMFEHEILSRDVSVHRLLYDRLISRIKEYDATDAKATIDVWVVEPARQTGFPINSHKPKRAIMLGLVGSVMAGLGLAIFLEHLDNKIKTSEDVEVRTDIPVFGMVPLFKDKEHEVEKIVHHLPRSSISERFKIIRTSLLQAGLSKCKPCSLLVTSMDTNTGKTVTAVNIALAMAQSERRVILIDADMRKPRIHKIFNTDNTLGLSTFLSGETGLEIQKTEESSFLDILTSGPLPPNPSELLSSRLLVKTMEELSSSYDLIVLDSPPLSDVTDALLIAGQTNQTLLVVRSGHTTYDSLAKAGKILKSLDNSLLGLVVNGVDEKKFKHFQYKYYGTYGVYTEEKTRT